MSMEPIKREIESIAEEIAAQEQARLDAERTVALIGFYDPAGDPTLLFDREGNPWPPDAALPAIVLPRKASNKKQAGSPDDSQPVE